MKTITLILALLFALPAMAQTTVTATITDSDGQTWNNGHGFATFQPGPINAYKCASTVTSPTSFTLNSIGQFSVSLADNTLCTPVGSTWAFTICPNASAKCYTSQQTVFGATQSLTAQLSAASVAPRFAATSSVQSYGYLDGEVTPIPVPGGWYFNVTNTIARQWNGTAWQNFGGGGGGGTIGGSTTGNEGVGTTGANNTLSPVAETGYETVGGVTTYTCNEDHAKGVWDVRCHGWSSNPSTALTNTIQLAMCYFFAPPSGAVSGIAPVIYIPSGSYSLGGNISIPPFSDIEGVGGTEHGLLSKLTTTDPTQPMMTLVASETFTCNGTPFTASGNGGTIGNLTLTGAGSTANTDVGINNTAGGDYIHNITFQQFGGPGRTTNGSLNNRGDHLLAVENLEWYYFSGAYNPSSFADTNPHGSLELTDVDGSWDNIEETGVLQDSGYFDRFFLVGLLFGGYRLTNSFIQINPHDVWVTLVGYSPIISQNRFDDGWWDTLHMVNSNSSLEVVNNMFLGYCTSPTLNPANFPSNPGGITTDPNCSAIEVGNLGTHIAQNNFEQLGAVWPFFSIGDVFADANVIGGAPSIIDQPGNAIIGFIGGVGTANIGADASRSLYSITATIGGGAFVGGGGPNIPLTNAGLGGRSFAHYLLNDSTASNYTGFTGGIPDTYLTIQLGPNSTITPSSTIFTCSGKPIIGTAINAQGNAPHTFWHDGDTFLEEVCPSGLGGTPQTTVNCSTSGTAVFAQPFSGPNYSAISIQSVACNGTASYTYPTVFTYTPSASGALSAIATTISTTAVTITGTGSSGFLKLEALQ